MVIWDIQESAIGQVNRENHLRVLKSCLKPHCVTFHTINRKNIIIGGQIPLYCEQLASLLRLMALAGMGTIPVRLHGDGQT